MNAPIHYLTHHQAHVFRVCEETPPSYQLSDWKQVDERITELGVERAAHEHEVCRRLLEAERLGVPARVGFASLRDSVSSNRVQSADSG